MMKVSEVMTRDPACCLPTDTVTQAAELMKTHDIGPIPVVESDQSKRLLGIITDRDVAVKVVGEGLDPKTTKVGDAMTSDPACSRPEEELTQAMERMADNQVRRLPIVDEEQRLIGIVAQADVATHLRESKKTGEMVREISKP